MKQGLFIADTPPFPSDTGGKLRTSHLLKQLSKTYEIDFVCFSMEQVTDLQKMLTKPHVRTAHFFYGGQPTISKRIMNFLKRKSNKAFVVYSLSMQKYIDFLLFEKCYDFIFIERLYCYPYIQNYIDNIKSKTKIFIDMHDVEHETIIFFRKITRFWLKKLYFSIEYGNIQRLERQAIQNADCMIAVSARDQQCYCTQYPTESNKWIIANNGVDMLAPQQEPIIDRIPASVLFLGSLSHPPNLHGLLWMIDKIWSRVICMRPDARLIIVGSGKVSSEHIALFESVAGVEFRGYVDNVYPLLQECSCMVVPLLSGSGTRLKILEAFSFRIPIVSTSIGAEGLPVENRRHLLIADTPDTIADRLVELIQSPQLAQSLSEQGYRLVNELYDWNIIGEKLRNEIDIRLSVSKNS